MKLLVISVPRLETNRPPISTAIIATVCEQAGHSVHVLDLNLKMYKSLQSSEVSYYDDIFEELILPTDLDLTHINSIIQTSLFEIDYDYILISVFGFTSIMFTKILCEYIRKTTTCKIVIGGMGTDNPKFCQTMLDKNLIDYFIAGEGEIAIIELLNGNLNYPGINKHNQVQIPNLDSLIFPNYKYFDLDEYDYLHNELEVNICGSRGCVRKCTYCDVAKHWPQFRYRSGKNISEEIISNYEQFGITRFYFTDSLINGSMKAFNDMCNSLINYNFPEQIRWGGQFIFKPKRQISDDYFKMISEAGGDTFYVGVETGSDKIRFEMDKKFTNDDIEYHLEHFKQNNISVMFLMIIGYLTENEDDYKETLKMFKRWQKYVASNTITGIDLSTLLAFIDNTPLMDTIEPHGVTFLNNNRRLWISKKNPKLTIKERLRRRLVIHKEAIKYKWPVWRGEQRLQTLKRLTLELEKYGK